MIKGNITLKYNFTTGPLLSGVNQTGELYLERASEEVRKV
jgi:hypothetical protein